MPRDYRIRSERHTAVHPYQAAMLVRRNRLVLGALARHQQYLYLVVRQHEEEIWKENTFEEAEAQSSAADRASPLYRWSSYAGWHGLPFYSAEEFFVQEAQPAVIGWSETYAASDFGPIGSKLEASWTLSPTFAELDAIVHQADEDEAINVQLESPSSTSSLLEEDSSAFSPVVSTFELVDSRRDSGYEEGHEDDTCHSKSQDAAKNQRTFEGIASPGIDGVWCAPSYGKDTIMDKVNNEQAPLVPVKSLHNPGEDHMSTVDESVFGTKKKKLSKLQKCFSYLRRNLLCCVQGLE